MTEVNQPIDFMRLQLGKPVEVQMRGDRELRGMLLAFDTHINLMMSGVEEATYEKGRSEPNVRKLDMLYIRGDGVILVSPAGKK
ncbi:putative U6 snRNA-associated Sm-like protein LSm3 [Diplonema papillatum]|nr:putative U6 snRNA-associated Sm-like protein LSm3 [Diplonema papillatum]WGM49938.1 LSm3 [Diplonema papillatum]